MSEDDSRALVADDDRWILDVAALILEGAGYTVTAVCGTQRVVEEGGDLARFELIVLDVSGSGHELNAVAEIRRFAPRARVVVMCSNEGLRDAAMARGADRFAPKPFTSRDLLGP